MSHLPAHELRRLEAVAPDEATFRRLVDARRSGTPLQYLEGTAPFVHHTLTVDERVLVPRPETEQLWELAVSSVSTPSVIVDVGTGSGALAIALSCRFPNARVLATDISADALDVASVNTGRLAPGIELVHGDLYEALPADVAGTVDLIVSNPPYVSESEWETLPEDVRREPRIALVAGETGIEVLGRVLEGASPWLGPDGVLVCEIGETQAPVLGRTAERHFRRWRIEDDLAGRPRFLVCRKG